MSIDLKSLPLSYVAKNGELTDYEAVVRVEGNGEFRVDLPEEVGTALTAMVDAGPAPGVSTDDALGLHVAMSKELDVLEWAIEQAIEQAVVTHKTTDRVIAYGPCTGLSAWQSPDGALHANGCIAAPDRGGWHPMGKGVNATHRVKHYSVGLYARVFDRTTLHSASGTHVSLKSPDWGHGHRDYPTYGAKLNGFAALGSPGYPSEFQYLPYTEEAAKYFYEALLRLCALGTHVHALFAAPETLTRAIAEGQHAFPDLTPKEPC